MTKMPKVSRKVLAEIERQEEQSARDEAWLEAQPIIAHLQAQGFEAHVPLLSWRAIVACVVKAQKEMRS